VSKIDLLIVEFLREGGEIKKQLVCSSGLNHARTAGKYAALTVMGMVAEAKELCPGDLLTVRIPIEGVDIPGDEEDAVGQA
jgi:hypothetical protein